MKIGIITAYNANNYGCFLQAFALENFLEDLGHKVYLIHFMDFNHGGSDYKDAFWDNLQRSHAKLHITENLHDDFDLIIYGSDEIWSMSGELKNSMYWGWHLRSKKKISYAASAQSLTFKKILAHPYTFFGLMKFNALSVRDNVSLQKISHLTLKRVYKVLDPTFLYNFNSIKIQNTIGNYLLVYTYDLNDSLVKEIKKFAKKNKLKIVCTGPDKRDWADFNLPVNPFEWIGLIKNAKFVISSTFHGTVFSILCHKQFFVMGTESAKVLDLLKDLGLMSRKTKTLEKIKDIDYGSVQEKLRHKIEYSKKFLRNNLNLEK